MAYSTKHTYSENSDEQLQRDVYAELKWDPTVTVTDIGVTVKDGIVTLAGKVPHYAEKAAAEAAARRIKGVMGVAEEIEVEPPLRGRRGDAEIAAAALHAFAWHVWVPKNTKLTVEKGWVTLTGEAQWAHERDAAANALRFIAGVRGITNRITLKPTVKPAEVKKKIKTALHRNAEIDAENITVKTEGGTVTLSGTVRFWAERDAALKAAWSAPGVAVVENHIQVRS